MGDILFNLAVIADLSANQPNLRVDWVVDRDFSALVGAHGGIRRVHPIPGREISRTRDISKKLKKIIQFFRVCKSIRECHYDHVIDTQGALKTSVIAALSRGKKKRGFFAAHLEAPWAHYAYSNFIEPARHLPAVFQYRKMLAEICGYSPQFERTQFFFQSFNPSQDGMIGKGGNTALFVPFSSKSSKELDAASMLEIIRSLMARGFEVIVTAGSDGERVLAEQLSAQALRPLRVLFRPIERFDEFKALLPGLNLCIGVDTGITHVAAAFRVPTIAIFAASEIQTYGPHHWAESAISIRADDPQLLQEVSAQIERHADQVNQT